MAHFGFSDTRLNIDVIIVTADWLLQEVARENMVRINKVLPIFDFINRLSTKSVHFYPAFILSSRKSGFRSFRQTKFSASFQEMLKVSFVNLSHECRHVTNI